MKLPTEFDRGQLEQLDQETLISEVLSLQQQVQQSQQAVAEQAVVIQSLRDQLAKDSHNSGKPPRRLTWPNIGLRPRTPSMNGLRPWPRV